MIVVIEFSVTSIANGNRGDANEMAAAFEPWETLELEYSNNPTFIRHVAKMVIEDAKFLSLILQAARSRVDWMRKAAGRSCWLSFSNYI